ncbi:hypothetical protein [Sphingomonas morindae]|uniref:Uncharacterized protein n=1 Tax=Sphingomonas morindae TaxID=1541170 RepID=A0ABY4X8X8_9SPHN|nr:hypothetical protein [Sphingomonas morindae]USI73360.1 hypothetical protein LHA26_02430 [Sphingomonas morindae]
MALPRPSRPLAAWQDFVGFLRSRERHDYIAALLAVAITSFILYAFYHDSYAERQPRIVYVESWPATRTDAEIKRDITAEQAARDRAKAERQAQYKRLADQLGIR